MRKVLAAVDFSNISSGVIDAAASLAEAYSADMILMHVAAPDPDFVGYDVGPESVRDARAHTLRTEHRELQAMAEALRQRGIRARALLVEGATVETILAETERWGADVIVLGSHGRGALGRVLLGSVSKGVLRDAKCAVHVLPAAGQT
jgi:nucleotide-binding universal stress UspA family protein